MRLLVPFLETHHVFPRNRWEHVPYCSVLHKQEMEWADWALKEGDHLLGGFLIDTGYPGVSTDLGFEYLHGCLFLNSSSTAETVAFMLSFLQLKPVLTPVMEQPWA